MFNIVYSCLPLCSSCPFFTANQMKNLWKLTGTTDGGEESGLSFMRGKHHKKNEYDVGVNEALKIIQCYNPLVYNIITSCGIPFLNARKIVRRLINLSIIPTDTGLCKYDYTSSYPNSCYPW